MHSVHLFTQFKILHDTLSRLPEDQQSALDRAVLGGGWIRDTNGNLLSELQVVALPATGGTREVTHVALPWPDSGTLALARSAVQAQLLVCEVAARSPRGDLFIHHHAAVADTDGHPLPMYTSVPRSAVQEVNRQVRAAIKASTVSVKTYRSVPLGETVRAAETQFVTRHRDLRVTKVKSADVFDVVLERAADDHQVTVVRRASYREGMKDPVPLLAGSAMRPLVLHALTVGAATPYGVIDGRMPDEPGVFTQQLLRQLTQRAAVPSKPDAGSPGTTRDSKSKKAAAGRPTLPASVPPAVPASPSPASTVPLPPVTPGSSHPAPPAAPVKPVPQPVPSTDPWVALTHTMAVDPSVVQAARATLERARPLLLTGAPGVGKTLLATLLADALCGPGNYTLVTADARWTSSEVIGGLKVMPGDTLRYAYAPGVVTRAAERHERSVREQGRPHALIIDEFNRAHQDEAFGRLLTLLDHRYRPQVPLVSEEDGAPQTRFLPHDFLLIGTLNDADTGRLHDLSAALQRRFTTVHLDVPHTEAEYLRRSYPAFAASVLDTLLAVTGDGRQAADATPTLRAHVPLGTHFMTEVIGYVQGGMTLDEALSTLLRPHLDTLSREALGTLAQTAGQRGLPLAEVLLNGAAALNRF